MPKAVHQAIIAIWITLGLSVIAALFKQWTDVISNGELFWSIFMYALLCIFPYKLSRGSNATRWVYTILSLATIAFVLTGAGADMPQADWAVLVLTAPIELFIIISLFDRESSQWFLWGSN